MLDSRLENKYIEVEKQAQRYLKGIRRAKWLIYSGLGVYFALYLALMLRSLLFGVKEFSFEDIILTSSGMVYFMVTLFVSRRLKRRARIYRPDADDWMLYYTCSILKSLEGYHKSKRHKLKEEHRKKQSRVLRNFFQLPKKIGSWVTLDWQRNSLEPPSQVSGTIYATELFPIWKEETRKNWKKQKMSSINLHNTCFPQPLKIYNMLMSQCPKTWIFVKPQS